MGCAQIATLVPMASHAAKVQLRHRGKKKKGSILAILSTRKRRDREALSGRGVRKLEIYTSMKLIL